MISIFVHSTDKNGAPLVADHFEFEAVPRVGEEVGVDQDGVQYQLRVLGVTHFAAPKGDFMHEVSSVHLACELAK